MATPRVGNPYLWTTWLTPVLAGDAQCLYAPWFRAHYTFEKVARGDFDLSSWKVQHARMVSVRVTQLLNDGWTVYTEDQNTFRLKGRTATVAGKPDLVVTKGDVAKVIDCKSGRRRDSDIQQVCVYLVALPLSHHAVKDRRLVGEVEYLDGVVSIEPEQFTEGMRAHIIATIKRMGDPTPPAKVPSARECAFCDISAHDCPDRIESAIDAAVLTTEF